MTKDDLIEKLLDLLESETRGGESLETPVAYLRRKNREAWDGLTACAAENRRLRDALKKALAENEVSWCGKALSDAELHELVDEIARGPGESS